MTAASSTPDAQVRLGAVDLVTSTEPLGGWSSKVLWGSDTKWGGSEAALSVIQQMSEIGAAERVDHWGNRTHTLAVRITAENLAQLAASEAALYKEVRKGRNQLVVSPAGLLSPTSVWQVWWSQLDPVWDYLGDLRITRYYRLTVRVSPYAYSATTLDLPPTWTSWVGLSPRLGWGRLPGAGSAPAGLQLLCTSGDATPLGNVLLYTCAAPASTSWTPRLTTTDTGTSDAGMVESYRHTMSTLVYTAPSALLDTWEGSADLLVELKAGTSSERTLTVVTTLTTSLGSYTATETVTVQQASGTYRFKPVAVVHPPLEMQSYTGVGGSLTVTLTCADYTCGSVLLLPRTGRTTLAPAVAGTRLVATPATPDRAAGAWQHSATSGEQWARGQAVGSTDGHVGDPDGTFVLVASSGAPGSGVTVAARTVPAWHTHAGA